ncbi:AAA family ATPase [Candidatus Nanohalococcus occultus]|uniref:Dephospho-CoA kinase n=1 Tax=Candidatus Nanohalococcus occultus TaxID=2978047 RepID=A0ABY8CH42_9ARCH|nr:Dephospho-CoA kinase [Candidatus Nanohaloarchaeota archaeon SVXNc]
MTEIYGITGMPLAGKTTVARMMKKKGFEVLDMGDVVRKERDKRDIPAADTGEFVNNQREEKGMDAIAQLSVPYLEQKAESGKVIITGMRGWNEKERFEEELGEQIEIIAVWTSREERRKRREKRQRKEDVEGDGFHERDLREIENGVGKLMALSDHLIKNDELTMEELREKVDEIKD